MNSVRIFGQKKLLFFFGIILLAAVAIFALLSQNQKSGDNSNNKNFGAGANKITVITTLFPLYDFAKTIGQDKVEVSLLLPPGLEAHSFEPRPSDIAKINEADVFLYTGKFMEPWAEDIIKGISGKDVKIVDSSSGVKMIPAVFHEHDEDEPEGAMDPHIWLDFDNAKIMVDNIARAFSEKDPANAGYYQQKANEYKNEISNLDNNYKATLLNCKSKTIVYGGHYAFGYLAKRCNLEYLAAQGLSPDAEPSAKDLVRLVQQIKKENIEYVFYEELTSPKIAQTLAGETKAKMLLLNAAHNVSKESLEKNTTFLSIMESNLENLKIGLGCK